MGLHILSKRMLRLLSTETRQQELHSRSRNVQPRKACRLSLRPHIVQTRTHALAPESKRFKFHDAAAYPALLEKERNEKRSYPRALKVQGSLVPMLPMSRVHAQLHAPNAHHVAPRPLLAVQCVQSLHRHDGAWSTGVSAVSHTHSSWYSGFSQSYSLGTCQPTLLCPDSEPTGQTNLRRLRIQATVGRAQLVRRRHTLASCVGEPHLPHPLLR